MNDLRARARERVAVNEFHNHSGAEETPSSSATLDPPQAGSAESAFEGPAGRMEGERPVQMKPGTYDVTYVRHELRNLVGCRAMELVMWFCVITPGLVFGTHVAKYYNVGNADPGETSANMFRVGFKCDLYRDYVRLVDEVPKGRNRVWINGFKDKIFKAEIHFADCDGKSQLTVKPDQPAVIEHLLENVT